MIVVEKSINLNKGDVSISLVNNYNHQQSQYLPSDLISDFHLIGKPFNASKPLWVKGYNEEIIEMKKLSGA